MNPRRPLDPMDGLTGPDPDADDLATELDERMSNAIDHGATRELVGGARWVRRAPSMDEQEYAAVAHDEPGSLFDARPA